MSTQQQNQQQPPIVLKGYLKKLKTHKKKYFVLLSDTSESAAKLEYYDNERKFLNNQPPKRSIKLGNCFNINRKSDTKYKYVIALHTRQDELNIVLDNEDEYNLWFNNLLALQLGRDRISGDIPQPNFAHVWNVHILNRGLGTGIIGEYRLCLTSDALSFVKPDMDLPFFELKLFHIRSCGNLRDFFFLEVGRSSSIGAGELWMETEDPYIAQNVHSTVFHAMCMRAKDKNFRIDDEDDLSPKSRARSSSATEGSKPQILQNSRTIFSQGNLNIGGNLTHQRTQSLPLGNNSTPNSHPLNLFKAITKQTKQSDSAARGRCDSMPSTSNRNRTISEGNQRLYPYRPNSMSSHSPPHGSPMSPPSEQGSGSSYSIADEPDGDEPTTRYSHSLTPEEAIVEEDYTENNLMYGVSPNYLPMRGDDVNNCYMDMSPKNRIITNNKSSPTTSMSSVTSGTPSTDIKFADYPLEKVSSYFGPNDDETRPIRAYSVGSKPDKINNCDSRTRAFSVGSKTKKVPNRILPPHAQPHNNHKSSSAPILTSRNQGSHSSIGAMDDLMEMDFSRSSSITSRNDTITSSSTTTTTTTKRNNGYVEMKPGNNGYVDMKPSKDNVVEVQSDYMVMDHSKFRDNPEIIGSKTNFVNRTRTDYIDMTAYENDNKKGGDYMDMFGSPKPAPGETPDGYVEMSLGAKSTAATALHHHNEDYTNMNLGAKKEKKVKKTQPINIQKSGQNNQKLSSSNSPIFQLFGRKLSSGTPPKMNLPLQPYSTSSLPRRKERRDSNSPSSSVTTPSSSSTIFPLSLNSPCSPKKDLKKDDYTCMDFNKNKQDYVNYQPSPRTTFPPSKPDEDDYAVMKPGSIETPKVYPIATGRFAYSITEPRPNCFRPISEDENNSGYETLRSPATRPNSVSSELCSSSSTLVGSRPESVNSDKRPGSSSSEIQLHYASLDLDDGSRSPRTTQKAAGGGGGCNNSGGSGGPSCSSGGDKSGSSGGGGGASGVGGVETQGEQLTYAAIDFVKSEGLKHNLTNKVKN